MKKHAMTVLIILMILGALRYWFVQDTGQRRLQQMSEFIRLAGEIKAGNSAALMDAVEWMAVRQPEAGPLREMLEAVTDEGGLVLLASLPANCAGLAASAENPNTLMAALHACQGDLAADGGKSLERMGLELAARGGEENYQKAAALYRLGLAAGNTAVAGLLGELHETGRGVARDEAQALRLYEQSAREGSRWAMYKVGTFYERGAGGAPLDAIQAYGFIYLASQSQALDPARRAEIAARLTALRGRLDREAIRQGEDFAARYIVSL